MKMAKIVKQGSGWATALYKLDRATKKKKQAEDSLNKLRDKIKQKMQSKDLDEVLYDDGSEKLLSVKVYTPRVTTLDHDRIIDILRAKQRRKCVDKIYHAEPDGLAEFVENHPELRKEFKEFITIEKVLDEDMLIQMVETGEVDYAQVEPFMEEFEKAPVFKVQRIKRKED